MPLPERVIQPVNVSRGTLQYQVTITKSFFFVECTCLRVTPMVLLLGKTMIYCFVSVVFVAIKVKDSNFYRAKK
jgi:hypothetical protein